MNGSNFLVKRGFLPLLCDIFVLAKVLVIQSCLCILYAYGRYINSNLGYVICSTHNNLILINFGYVAGLYFYTYLCI